MFNKGKMMTDRSDVLTSRQVMDILGLSKNTVNELLRTKTIPNVRAGKKYLVSRELLDAWLKGEIRSSDRGDL